MKTSALRMDGWQIAVIALLLLVLSPSITAAAEYGAVYNQSPATGLVLRPQPGQTAVIPMTVTNTGTLTWPSNGNFKMSYHWFLGSQEVVHDGLRTALPATVAQGQSTDLAPNVQYPNTEGTYTLKWDMFREGVGYFSSKGVPTKDVLVNVGYGDLAVKDLTVKLVSSDLKWDGVQVSVVVRNLGKTMEINRELVVTSGGQVIKQWVSDFLVGSTFTVTFANKFAHHPPGTSQIPVFKAVISQRTPGVGPGGHPRPVLVEKWDKDLSNNSTQLQMTEMELHHGPVAGDCLITEIATVPLAGNRLSVTIKVTNQLPVKVSGLHLILAKNHVGTKEWTPIGLGPGAASQVSYLDDKPAPFHTNYYEAILSTTGDPIANPSSVLDRKQAQYRTAGTVTGGP